MLPEIVAVLECPCCRERLRQEGGTLRCPSGHSFDVARSGYVSFLVGRRPRIGDTPEMVAARANFLGAGHFEPLSRAISAAAGCALQDFTRPEFVERRSDERAVRPIAVEIGAGTAWHLARILDTQPRAAGLAVDVSSAAARHAARAHERIGAIAADARRTLPVARSVASVVLVAFAPRNEVELRRILRPDGALVVVTPLPEHLAELRPSLGLIGIDPAKPRRLATALSSAFSREESREVRWSMNLDRSECETLVGMGPSSLHVSAEILSERARALPPRTRVTGACRVEVWRPR